MKIPREEGYATAKILDLFNKLFDSVNAHEIKSNTPLRVAVTKNSGHYSFWYDAIKQLQNIKFIDKRTRKPVSTPSLNNWITTIKGFQKLWAIVNKAGIKSFKTRNCNQDPLENFFGLIRSHNRRNVNPTCSNFESSFKTLLINNLTGKHSVGNNCEKDTNGEVLFSLQNFVEDSIETLNTSDTITDTIEEIAQIDNISDLLNDDELISNGVYIHIIDKLFYMQSSNCQLCKENISLQTIKPVINKAYIIYKNKMPSICFRTGIRKKFNTIIKDEVDFSFFKCEEHELDFKDTFIQIILENFSIAQWCSNINKKITGKDRSKPTNIIEKQATHYFNTRSKNVFTS